MFLKSENISLRAVEPSDIDNLYLWENDVSIWRVSNTVTPYSRFQIEEYVLNARYDLFSVRQLRLMIDLHSGDQKALTIGNVDLFDFDPMNRRAGLGILVSGAYRNMGYAGEAIDLIVAYARETLRLHQVYCHISEENHPSIRLFESKGFIRCGVKKEWLETPRGWQDEWMYQLILDSFTDRA